MATTVRVRGLKELTRSFKRISKDLDKRLVDELKEAAAPVADDAEQLALSRIRNMPASPHWAAMRIGVSRAQGLVYMVPAARGRRRKRRNLSDLLLTRAMDPAVEKNEDQVLGRIENLIDSLGDREGF